MIGAVFRREWRALIGDPLTLGAVGFLAAVLGFGCVLFGAERAIACAPWAISAGTVMIGMRAWAGEWAGGGGDALLASPVSVWALVGGKVLAGWCVMGGALLCSAPAFVAQAFHGALDGGVGLAAGLAAVLMAGACLSLCHAVSALVQTPTLAAILGALVCGVAHIGATEPAQSFLIGTGAIAPADALQRLSLLGAYQALAVGVLDVGAILVLISAAWLAAGVTASALVARRGG